ncbi:MAG: hypothetical protein ACTSXU_16230, partial [Promethearchaeota archaeon]
LMAYELLLFDKLQDSLLLINNDISRCQLLMDGREFESAEGFLEKLRFNLFSLKEMGAETGKLMRVINKKLNQIDAELNSYRDLLLDELDRASQLISESNLTEARDVLQKLEEKAQESNMTDILLLVQDKLSYLEGGEDLDKIRDEFWLLCSRLEVAIKNNKKDAARDQLNQARTLISRLEQSISSPTMEKNELERLEALLNGK